IYLEGNECNRDITPSIDSAKVFKHGVVLQAPGKALLVACQTRAHQMMHAAVAKFVHLAHGFFRCPALFFHAIGCNHHSSPIITEPTVHEDFLAWIFSRDSYEPRKYLIFGKRTIPR